MDDLPEEVMDLVFARLPPKDFLSLCKTSKSFYEQHHLNPFYWRNEASSTFRLPISPLLRADGARWYFLYKKLKTQTRLYTWGQGTNGNLGPSQSSSEAPAPAAPRPPPALRGPLPRIRGHPRVAQPNTTWERSSSSWPTQVHLPDEVDVIVDVQCGGWSTSLLTSDGKLFSVGILDAADMRHIGKRFQQFTRLEYLTQSTSSIQQFSAGRRHVLALDDNGEVLSWDRINEKGYRIYPRDGRTFGGRIRYVCAGWGFSSAYIPSKGIVYWHPVENDRDDVMLDGIHVKEYTIAGTASQKRMVGEKEVDVEVLRHIVLEGWIIFLVGGLTADVESKLFACRIGGENPEETSPLNPVLEIPGYAGETRHLQDLQGSFRSFAVFTATGEVLAGNTNYLNACALNVRTETSIDDTGNSMAPRAEVQVSDELLAGRPHDIPVLQHRGVIGIAFGDYHSLALHADGTITAHGRDPSGVGALGLGNPPTYAKFRGLRQAGQSRDYDLLPIAAQHGRQVWFEPEKKDWLEWLDHGENPVNMFGDSVETQAAFSEWVEQEGRRWEDGPAGANTAAPQQNANSSDVQDYNLLGAYFAIAVTAAGWHSGALVMTNDQKANSIREKWMPKTYKPIPSTEELGVHVETA
jgi:SCF-associated factor 1